MYRPVLTAAPASTPVSLAEAKAQCRVDHGDDDELITRLIAAATSLLDGWTGILGRCIFTQTWRQDFDRFSHCLRLPLFPVASISSVKYDDADDVEQTVTSTNYVLLVDELGAYVEFIDTYAFPQIHHQRPAVRVAYVAGEAAPPGAIRHAMLLLIEHWYDNRGALAAPDQSAPLPFAVDALLAPFRRNRF